MTYLTRYLSALHTLVAGAFLLGGVAIAAAQGSAVVRGPAAATLPESNEAMLLSDRARDAMQRGDYRLAIRLIEQIMALPAELVAAPASRTYYPVWRQAVRLLGQLPPEGVDLYRRLYDAEVAARFREAVQAADVDTLRELFHDYRASSDWDAVGAELVARLIDRGEYGESIEAVRELLAGSAEPKPERRAQLIVALAQVGAWQAAQQALAELESDSAVALRPGWRQRVGAIREWLERLNLSRRNVAGRLGVQLEGRPYEPMLAPPIAWSHRLDPEAPSDTHYEAGDLAAAIDRSRRLPLHNAVVDSNILVVRMNGSLWGMDALTLTPIWRSAESAREVEGTLRSVWGRRGGGGVANDEAGLSTGARRLLTHALRHALSTGLELVFTIESLALESEHGRIDRRGFRSRRDGTSPNVLVARDLRSGRTVWRAGDDLEHKLYRAAFQDAPAVVGRLLVVPVQRNSDLYLCVIDPADGRLIREVPIVGPPTYFTSTGGRCLLATDETTVYVCTGNGVIAALGRADLQWKWATVYPSTLSEHLNGMWWEPERSPRESGIDRPIVVDDLLVVAPVDSSEIIAIDRFSGRERWRVPRGEYAFLVGGLTVFDEDGGGVSGGAGASPTDGGAPPRNAARVETGLVVGGHSIACLDLADGRSLRWRSVPLETTGRPTLGGGRVFVPTREGIVVLDGRTGKVLVDQLAWRAGARRSGEVVVANLLATEEALFSITPDQITKYPDPRAARRRCDELLETNPNDPYAQLAAAWLNTVEGRFGDALAALEALRPADAGLVAARDRLLLDVFVKVSSASANRAQRIDWLRRAAALSVAPSAAARLAVLIGEALEQHGRWDEALEHYRGMLLQESAVQVRDPNDPARSIAQWAWAAQRMHRCLEHLPEAQRAAFVDRLARDVTVDGADAAIITRARLVAKAGPARDSIDRALTLSRRPPELIVQHLTERDESALPADLRRQLHLARWETHVALGMLDAARADREIWRTRFEGADPPSDEPGAAQTGGGAAESQRRRLTVIQTAFSKLEQSAGVPFERQFRRQWKMQDAELILDWQEPEPRMQPWLLLRRLANRQIVLFDDNRRSELRRTRDALLTGGAAETARTSARDEVLFGRAARSSGPLRTTWPAAVYEHLAAVPVRGGLVCVGLGPERHAGARLWEVPVRAWREVPRDFVQTAVTGPWGVGFCPRPDRFVVLDWNGGALRWQRDFPGSTIREVTLAGDRLVFVADEQHVLTVDAWFGDDLREIPPELGTPRGVRVCRETLLIWGGGGMTGLDPATLQPLWKRAGNGIHDVAEIPQRGWVVVRESDAAVWSVLDASSGRPVLKLALDGAEQIVAIAATDSQIYVAARAASDRDSATRQIVLSAHAASDGRRHWQRTIETAVAVNITQLLAHDEFIPILLAEAPAEGRGAASAGKLAIQLVEKRTGELVEAVPIGEHFKKRDTNCGVYMLATPTRMIVQASGNLVAFGNSSLSRKP